MPVEAEINARISLGELTRVFARVALLSFGGPAGQMALMHRVLVDEKKWLSERRFLHALNFCMLLPGPEAQQLATYVGWLMHGVAGGLIAGGLFILPGAAAIMALSVVYASYGATPAVEGAFFGLKAAVLALVFSAILRLGERALQTRAQQIVAALAFLALFLFDAPFPLVVVGAGAAGSLFKGFHPQSAIESSPHEMRDAIAQPDAREARNAAFILAVLWLAPLGALFIFLGPEDVYARIALFFSKMAAVTFGGAYAALSYVAQQAVERFHWLTPAEMLDGLGMAETTPGPLIMVLQFVGFMAAYRNAGAPPPLVAGALGGLLATYVTFVPCFLWIFAGAPFIERLRENKALSSALSAIAAAVVGVIANLALWFATHFLFRGHWTLAPLPVRLPDITTFDATAFALSMAAGALLRFGLAPALIFGAGAGLLVKLI
ncbi:chromate efflux transporter [Methylocystis parvus]|uniref:Chromate efflux transporter n=1 Tax=Methylocystis parvus TaxID=134 RepID=A0A6B8M641_9HYPH|nr:chromate efflux transporter [Methylocystis parvus]QGM97815.1 chromate efflux transporter [Methylocystis parvus]WBK01875.1 chromate efflux transporter [Methylocystis parvus OBBP]